MLLYKSLLLVDDDVDDHEIFMAALENISSDVDLKTAENGLKALQLLRQKAVTPELIFLDINMPLMNGFQFLSELKKQDGLKDIPVIMYSTTSAPEAIEQAKQTGAIDFISKPENFSELELVLQRILYK